MYTTKLPVTKAPVTDYMKQIFNISDKKLIASVIDNAEYGVLAMSVNNIPYVIPVNFVYHAGAIYFHGSPKGKKMQILKDNNQVSFNIVSEPIVIPSYFSSVDGLACPATVFFKSVIIDGKVNLVESKNEKYKMFKSMMQKLQPEGNYAAFAGDIYDKELTGVAIMKINIKHMTAKFKFGQNLNQERFDLVIKHLTKRGKKSDLLLVKQMRKFQK